MSVKLIGRTQSLIPEMPSMGDMLAYCARVSNPNNQHNQESAPKLLSYLAKNAHWSPFEMCHLTMEITTTRDIARQILRHRSFAFQEFSGRYAVMPNKPVLREARLQDTKNRQNSLETNDADLQVWFKDIQRTIAAEAGAAYEAAMQKGIAKEQARAVLPEGLTESRLYIAGSVRSFIHYCQVRGKPDTQKEHRAIAMQVRDILVQEMPQLEEVLK